MSISEVERETGIAKDSLRVWERRYQFPQPQRDANGERAYPADQVAKLRAIRRLMDQGHRPGKIFEGSVEDLRHQQKAVAVPESKFATEVATMVDAVKAGDVRLLRTRLGLQLATLGTTQFVTGLVTDLIREVGNAWARGELPVYAEHIVSEQIEAILRNITAQILVKPTGPRILMTTLPGERHKLGLLMLEALLAVELAQCIPLGTQSPISDIIEVTTKANVDIVALSFSSTFAPKAAVQGLTSLRAALPPQVAIWAGGDGVKGLRKRPAGVEMPMTLTSAISALRKWQQN